MEDFNVEVENRNMEELRIKSKKINSSPNMLQ